jgi:hypothetical protein
MTITYPIPFSLNLDDEREREQGANKIQHITLSFKTFCGLKFSNHWLLLVISPQNKGYRIKIYSTQNITSISYYKIPNHSYRNICIIGSGMLQTQLISHQYCMHTETTSNKIQLH